MFPILKKILEIRLGSRIRISIFLMPVAVCSIVFGYSTAFFAAYLMALLHELAHIGCARFFGVKISHIALYPFGVTARLSDRYIDSSPKEFIIAFAGPLVNLILFWICNFLNLVFENAFFQFCADVNLAICTVNLVPALPLDGGRMLKSVLTTKFGVIRAYNISLRLSRWLISVLAALAVILFLLFNFNFSLILISAFLLQNLNGEQATISKIALKEILENNRKFKKRHLFPTKTFLVKADTIASNILRLLSYDYFCIFHIADKDARIIGTVTETEVLDALTQVGASIKFGDIHPK